MTNPNSTPPKEPTGRPESLHAKLLKSDTYQSLRAEQEVHACLTGHGWRSAHSVYYEDPETGKIRELDGHARRYWHRPEGAERRNAKPLARVHLLVESKSNTAWSLLFSTPPTLDHSPLVRNPDHFQMTWLGRERQVRESIGGSLIEAGVPLSRVREILRRCHMTAYPEETSCVSDLCFPLPAPRDQFTAFRETNTSKEKELEASVLWAGSRTLFAAQRSLLNAIIDGQTADVVSSATMVTVEQRDEREVDESVLDVFRRCVYYTDIVHPVLSINSPLWALREDGTLEELSVCRLHFQAITPRGWWLDVVWAPKLDEFLGQLTSAYAESFAQRGALPGLGD